MGAGGLAGYTTGSGLTAEIPELSYGAGACLRSAMRFEQVPSV
jgi:hypothetical protein